MASYICSLYCINAILCLLNYDDCARELNKYPNDKNTNKNRQYNMIINILNEQQLVVHLIGIGFWDIIEFFIFHEKKHDTK